MRAVVVWWTRSPLRAFLLIFLLAFAVRGYFYLFRFPEVYTKHPGVELRAIALSLMETGSFADPYAVPTGPTAHLPPVYVGFVALVWKLLGPTQTAGVLLGAIGIAASSAAYALMPWFAGRVGMGERSGVVAGVAGALTPRSANEMGFAWEEPYAALALMLLLAAFLRQWTGRRIRLGRAFLLGTAAGATLHLAPNLLLVVSGCLLFGLWWRRSRRQVLATLLMGLGVLAASVPWGWRNVNSLGGLVPVRSNFGLELRLGNHEGALSNFEATYRLEGSRFRHPYVHVAEAREVARLGELEYMRRAGKEALDWIADNPGAFLGLTARRTSSFWFGAWRAPLFSLALTLLTLAAALGAVLALPRLAPPQRAVLLLPLILYPVVYYLVGYADRYRTPIHWILVLLAGAALWRGLRTLSPEKGGSAT